MTMREEEEDILASLGLDDDAPAVDDDPLAGLGLDDGDDKKTGVHETGVPETEDELDDILGGR
jgi:hypothetical protein